MLFSSSPGKEFHQQGQRALLRVSHEDGGCLI